MVMYCVSAKCYYTIRDIYMEDHHTVMPQPLKKQTLDIENQLVPLLDATTNRYFATCSIILATIQ